MMCEDIVGAFKGWYGYYQSAAAYQSQPKSRTHLSGELLQEFATAV
jgi:hypothetical protein